ncbi:MAG: pro-sigmaK processing inhibitor BofA family protein [Candidatus Marsarchaeota archaeon]|nr:pro-sigmaK processing inhibitor BofA family protein [Candidatus Marsarchaeota archaeon]MCL5094811.1 pro-sigmaK processing inhibitor BofA family protein [Candidatus Marsarchaeota archaeon]
MLELLELSSIGVELIIIAAIGILLFLIFKVGKSILRLIFGLIANSILGLIAIFALNYLFKMEIPINLAIILSTMIFGLPAVGTFVILHLFGIPL